jgi:hypothetical protein
MRGTNVFSLIGKQLRESNLGRLRITPCRWVLTEKVTKRDVLAGYGHTGVDSLDRPTTLVKGKGVYCPDIERMGKDHAIEAQGRWVTVKLTDCRKCSFHRAAKQRHISFATCAFKGEKSKTVAGVQSLVQLSELWKQAEDKVQEMLK